MIKKKTAYLRKTSPVGVEVNNKDWLLQMIPKWRKNGVETHPKDHYTIIIMKINTTSISGVGGNKCHDSSRRTMYEHWPLQPVGGVRIWCPKAWRNPFLHLGHT